MIDVLLVLCPVSSLKAVIFTKVNLDLDHIFLNQWRIMDLWHLLFLGSGGFVSGFIAGILGIGGGTLLVPLIVTLGYLPIEAIATSSLAILMTAMFGSFQNWSLGHLQLKKVIYLAIPAGLTAQLGVLVANKIAPYLLLAGFGLLLLLHVTLISLRKSLAHKQHPNSAPKPTTQSSVQQTTARLTTGGTAGFIAGLFGLGGGVFMVPLQVILLGENIKAAIQTSLGVIVITAIFACGSHAMSGNVLLAEGICLGIGGLFGVQLSTRFLPKLPENMVIFLFRGFMGLLAGYMFVKAWHSYLAT